jgi:hypothetical protein
MNSTDISRIGAFGGALVTSATAQTGTWLAIVCLSATVFATLTETGFTRSGTIGSVVFPAGVTIYGAFTNFTLTSGSVRCYSTRNTTANP